MRIAIILGWMLVGAYGSAQAQVSVAIGLPSVQIGINLGGYPDLVPVAGYPVYYAPWLEANLFFYDGLYWVYARDNWYASSWYDGPWDMIGPEYVPYYVLRVPVRYYRRPPAYFGGWGREEPPRWGQHWGRDWEQHHGGWDRWDRRAIPNAAPLPTYQREYSGSRYPSPDRQRALRESSYRYQPVEPVVRQHYERPAPQAARPRDDRPTPAASRDSHDSRPTAPRPSGGVVNQERPPTNDRAPQRRADQPRVDRPPAATERAAGASRPEPAQPANRTTTDRRPAASTPVNARPRESADSDRAPPRRDDAAAPPARSEPRRSPPPPRPEARQQGNPGGQQRQEQAPRRDDAAAPPARSEPRRSPPLPRPEARQQGNPGGQQRQEQAPREQAPRGAPPDSVERQQKGKRQDSDRDH